MQALQLSLEVCSAVLSPKGAITGNHTDVFHSVNHGFCGKKLWFWWDFEEAEKRRLLNRTQRRAERAKKQRCDESVSTADQVGKNATAVEASSQGDTAASTTDGDEYDDDLGSLMNPAYHGQETFDFTWGSWSPKFSEFLKFTSLCLCHNNCKIM